MNIPYFYSSLFEYFFKTVFGKAVKKKNEYALKAPNTDIPKKTKNLCNKFVKNIDIFTHVCYYHKVNLIKIMVEVHRVISIRFGQGSR